MSKGACSEFQWAVRIERRRMMGSHDRITVDPKVLVGKPVIRGTRIAVAFVLELLGRGWTVEQVLRSTTT
jgi:uncharacterized protein (DUF433 family)